MIRDKAKSAFTASNFRMVLSAGVIIFAIGIALGFSFGIKLLREYAVDVSHKKVDALASNNNVQSLQKLDQQLKSYQDALQKAESLKISGEFPEFRIVDEVQSVARKSGITISSYSYGDASSTATGTPATGTPNTTTPSTSSPATGTGNTLSLTVNVSSPVNYKKLLQFLYDVEHHIPKMELNGVSISPVSSGNADSVSVDALSIQMYIKK